MDIAASGYGTLFNKFDMSMTNFMRATISTITSESDDEIEFYQYFDFKKDVKIDSDGRITFLEFYKNNDDPENY